MIRKLGAALLAVACAVGFAVASGPVADAGSGSVRTATVARAALPTHGTYRGVDHAGRTITFSFSGNYMGHFTVNHTVIGGAHVSNGAWHETCHNGLCTKGMWVTDNHVTGAWRHGGGSWTSFSAYLQPMPTITPYVGSYMGQDHTGLQIHLTYRHGQIVDFRLDHSTRGNIPVTNGRFDTCLPSICVKGHWQSDTEVVGTWRPAHGTQLYSWEAYAYAH